MVVLFDILVGAMGRGRVQFYGVPLAEVGARTAAMAAFLNENTEAPGSDLPIPPPGPIVPVTPNVYAATKDGVQEIVPPKPRATPHPKAIYTNAQFDQVCGERNIETGERCASLKKHRGKHAWRMVTDGAQPVAENHLVVGQG